MKSMLRLWAMVGALVLCPGAQSAEATRRPAIWVRAADREEVLRKIRAQPWARAQFETLRERTEPGVVAHEASPEAYLRRLPWLPAEAGEHPALARIGGNMASDARSGLQTPLQALLGEAIDSGVLHFLTGETRYAAAAADILHAVVRALRGIEPNPDPGNGGWLYTDDHLYEARAVGAQVPIIYDFVADYLRRPETRVFNLASGTRIPFPFGEAQQVFRTYARLAVEHGMSDSNWPVLEMPSLTHNALALDDPDERAALLEYVIHRDTERQDPLTVILKTMQEAGGVWPESLQYSAGVADNVTYIVALLRRQQPSVRLPAEFAIFPRSLLRLGDFRFPNGEFVRFGDGPRRWAEPLRAMEIAYAEARSQGLAAEAAEFGGVLARSLESRRLDRARLVPRPSGANINLSPLSLLWFQPEIVADLAPRAALPVVDQLPFAGLVLQRNLAPDGDRTHGLMAAVHGAHYIHAHASGMSLELYGTGQVQGTNAGKGVYRSDDHENYRRLFAAHNGVIVNGASRTSGGWVNLGMPRVETVTSEPRVGAAPVSPRHSFVLTRFVDSQGPGLEAQQERLVGIIRTGPASGFYVDVFRSRADGPAQFHDYVYHNIGDSVGLRAEGKPLVLEPAPGRFAPVPGAKWKSNDAFLFPGWHVFRDVEAAHPSSADVVAEFSAGRLGSRPIGMRLFIPGAPGREYARAFAPAIKEAPGEYDRLPSPVLIMRSRGETWARPFAVVFEPFGATPTGSIASVAALAGPDGFSGLRIEHREGEPVSRDYVLVLPSPESAWEDAATGISFRGRYAVISLNAAGGVASIYLGEGSGLRCGDAELRGVDGTPIAAFADLTGGEPRVTSRRAVEISWRGERRVIPARDP